MAAKNKPAPSRDAADPAAVVALLKRKGTKRTRDGMACYAIPSDSALGVTLGELKTIARRLGKSHEMAAALWASGWYEARMLAAMIDDAACVTPAHKACRGAPALSHRTCKRRPALECSRSVATALLPQRHFYDELGSTRT